VIRWRGFFSCEGVGLAFTALIVYSDFVGLIFPQFFLNTEGMSLSDEAQLRVYPLVLLILAILALCAGRYLGSFFWTRPLNFNLSLRHRVNTELRYLGWFLTVLGLGMNLYGLYSAGFRSLSDYYSNMYRYQVEQQGYGFLDNGVNIGVLGLSVLAASCPRVNLKFLLYIVLAIGSAFLISVSKSGINSALVMMSIIFYLFNPPRLRWLLRPARILMFLLVLLIGLGIKTQIKYGFSTGQKAVSLSSQDIYESSLWSVQRRYGPFGLFRGYCYLIETLSEKPYYRMGGAVIFQELTAWIPKVLWPDKPTHSFNARGDLITEDYYIDPDQNHAPTFAGYAYSDFGVWSLVMYPILGGLVLAWLESRLLREGASDLSLLAYAFFVAHMGPGFSESGFLSLFYYLVFTFFFYLSLVLASSFRTILPKHVAQNQADAVGA